MTTEVEKTPSLITVTTDLDSIEDAVEITFIGFEEETDEHVKQALTYLSDPVRQQYKETLNNFKTIIENLREKNIPFLTDRDNRYIEGVKSLEDETDTVMVKRPIIKISNDDASQPSHFTVRIIYREHFLNDTEERKEIILDQDSINKTQFFRGLNPNKFHRDWVLTSSEFETWKKVLDSEMGKIAQSFNNSKSFSPTNVVLTNPDTGQKLTFKLLLIPSKGPRGVQFLETVVQCPDILLSVVFRLTLNEKSNNIAKEFTKGLKYLTHEMYESHVMNLEHHVQILAEEEIHHSTNVMESDGLGLNFGKILFASDVDHSRYHSVSGPFIYIRLVKNGFPVLGSGYIAGEFIDSPSDKCCHWLSFSIKAELSMTRFAQLFTAVKDNKKDVFDTGILDQFLDMAGTQSLVKIYRVKSPKGTIYIATVSSEECEIKYGTEKSFLRRMEGLIYLKQAYPNLLIGVGFSPTEAVETFMATSMLIRSSDPSPEQIMAIYTKIKNAFYQLNMADFLSDEELKVRLIGAIRN